MSSRNDNTLDWDQYGKQYKQISRHHLELSIQQEIASDTHVKYKELLIAFLSTIMLEVPSTETFACLWQFQLIFYVSRSPAEIIATPRDFSWNRNA
jgi:hypothetical protein